MHSHPKPAAHGGDTPGLTRLLLQGQSYSHFVYFSGASTVLRRGNTVPGVRVYRTGKRTHSGDSRVPQATRSHLAPKWNLRLLKKSSVPSHPLYLFLCSKSYEEILF